jgi:hypothetical protein
MQRLILWGGIAGITACLVRPNFVSVTPDYGYYDSDGCYEVLLAGHKLGTEATATIGGAEITNLAAAEENPDVPEQAQDVGFEYTGFAPASPSGAPGWFDVTMTVDGEELTIKEGWFYKDCVGPTEDARFNLDAFDIAGTASFTTTTPTTTVVASVPAVAGDVITMEGCGLTEDVSVVIMDPAIQPTTPAPTTTTNPLCTGEVVETIPIEVLCPAAIAQATLPDIAAGNYIVKFVHSDGYEYVGECGVDSGDTGVSCDCIPLVMGGAK